MNEVFKKIFEHNGFQKAVVLAGVAATLVNVYIAIKLAPLAENINSVTTRVEAIEKRNTNMDLLVPRFIVVEAKVNDIQARVDRIENKVDVLLTR